MRLKTNLFDEVWLYGNVELCDVSGQLIRLHVLVPVEVQFEECVPNAEESVEVGTSQLVSQDLNQLRLPRLSITSHKISTTQMINI